MKKRILTTFVFFLFTNPLISLDVDSLKLEMAKLENVSDSKTGLSTCNKLLEDLKKENKKNDPEMLTWEGIILAKMAFYKKPSPSALNYAKEAKSKLELAISIDANVSEGAALNALALLYSNVPKFISFGDDKKSEEYFKKAILSNNIDTNWRYGEFLIKKGRKKEALEYLKKAISVSKPNSEIDKIKIPLIEKSIIKLEK